MSYFVPACVCKLYDHILYIYNIAVLTSPKRNKSDTSSATQKEPAKLAYSQLRTNYYTVIKKKKLPWEFICSQYINVTMHKVD